MQMRFSIRHFETDTELKFAENVSWLVLHGRGSLCVGKLSYCIHTHDFIRLPVDKNCILKVDSPVTVGVVYLFDMVATRKECQVISSSQTELIADTFMLALKVEESDSPNRMRMINAVWQVMWEAIIDAGVKGNPTNAFVQDVLKQINDHYQDSSFDLAGIIQKTGYSPGHFRKIFKEETGLPPLEHLNMRRLECAKKMMWQESGKITVKAVAENSGFTDANNFTKFFKRTMGITPGKYIEEVILKK